MALDHTHDPKLTSWIESANDPATDFPIQNLPLCAFVREGVAEEDADQELGVAIGDRVLDLRACAEAGMFDGAMGDADLDEELTLALQTGVVNYLASMGPAAAAALRRRLVDVLRSDSEELRREAEFVEHALVPMSGVRLVMPADCANYTDFYASKHHATNVGSMFRPDNPLLPNYTHIPIAYHGRASSLVVSGTPVRRPKGQTKADDAAEPTFGACKMLDYELELGVLVGRGNELGEPVPIAEAGNQIFGLCIVNDWSARDIQKWEYQPLGPFLAKNFATSLSPFVVMRDALEPFRVPGPERGEGDPRPLDYLRGGGDWGLDITVEAYISSEQMRQKGKSPQRISRGSFKHMYWTIAQMITHHASSGCNLLPADLLASGTISGPERDARGCLLELTWDGRDEQAKPRPRQPVSLPTGETRLFLQDGDEVILRAFCERAGYRRIGFGECRGVVLPARG